MLHRFPVIFITLLSLYLDVQPGVFPDSVFWQKNKSEAIEVVLLKSLHHPWPHLQTVLRAQFNWSLPKGERGSVWAVTSPQWLLLATHTPGLISLHAEVTQHPEVQSTVQEMFLPSALWTGMFLVKLWFLSPVSLYWCHLGGRQRARAGCSFPVRAVSDLGAWGRVFLQEVWQSAWPGGCLSPVNALSPSHEGAVWRGAAITAPGVMGLSPRVVLLLGGVCLSVGIFLQFPWWERWVTCIPSGDISMFLLFFRLLWHFLSPVVGASGSIICSRCQQGWFGPSAVTVGFCSSWHAQFGSGFLM